MKKTLLIIIIATFIPIAFFYFFILQKPKSQIQPIQALETTSTLNPSPNPQIKPEKLQELKISPVGKAVSKGVTSDIYAFKAKDNSTIQIGTQRHSPPKPYIKLDKWDGEVALKINMPFETGDNPQVIGNKIRYSTADSVTPVGLLEKFFNRFIAKAQESTPRVDIDIYPKQPETITETVNGKVQTSTQNEDGGVEFDTILYGKPDSNKIIFPIETANLDFFYQPAQNQKTHEAGIVCTETYCTDKNNNVVDYMPENVLGSYAVYYKDHKSGDYTAMGGKNYKAGKAFHIYRPKIHDNAGNEVWGILNVDEKAGVLSVEIPQDFLDHAQFPVTVDPTFGYTTKGALTGTYGADSVYLSYASPANGNGVVDSISIYAASQADQSGHYKAVLFNSDKNIATNGVGGIANYANATLLTMTYTTKPSVVNGTNYYVGAVIDVLNNTFYDNADTIGGESANNYTTPIAIGTIVAPNYKWTLYATYTPPPTLTSIADSIDPVGAGSTQTITPSGQTESNSANLYIYCCQDTANSCTPTTANVCTNNQAWASPYTTMTCTINAPFPATQTTYYARCLVYNGSQYSSTVRSTSYSVLGTTNTTVNIENINMQGINIR